MYIYIYIYIYAFQRSRYAFSENYLLIMLWLTVLEILEFKEEKLSRY